MMQTIEFFVPGTPIPQKRHYTSTMTNKFGKLILSTSGRVAMNQHDPSAADKELFRMKCLQYRPRKLIKSGIILNISFRFERPKSHYRTGKYSNLLKKESPAEHIVKPDKDNLLKFVMDSFNRFFWVDDCQVYDGQEKKRYTPKAGTYIQLKYDDEID